jgi:hypothetical protein
MESENESCTAHTLYIVLQGEFVLFRERTTKPDHDILHIAAPYVPGHVYKAGPWLSDWENLDELPSTRLHLRHAFGDRKQGAALETLRHHPRAIPEKNTDLLMSCGPEYANFVDARVHITAPVPLAILSGLAETADGVAITFTPPKGRPTVRAAPSHAAVIPILMYEWYDHRPYLADEDGDCIAKTGGPSDDFQSMNIYASSPVNEDSPSHAQDAFHRAALLLGENASITWPHSEMFLRLPATPPAGLTWCQINLFFSDVLEHQDDPILRARFVDLQDSHHPFDATTLLGGQTTNCGSITGDDDGGDGD